MSTPRRAFGDRSSDSAHPLMPGRRSDPSPLAEPALKTFSVRLPPATIRAIKIACAERDVDHQQAAAEAWGRWLADKPAS